MALIMTHIRFAMDLADRFPIKEMAHYISGTVYPDSRWVSRIDRELTHHEQFKALDFPFNDFTKGWQVHCICDHVQNDIFEDCFPEVNSLTPEERWVQLSVAKIIQDMADLQQFNLEEQLAHLDYVINPNKEDIHRVKTFYNVIRETYHNRSVPTIQDYKQFWLDVGLSEILVEKIVQGLELRLRNPESVRLIEATYEKMCRQADQISF